LIVACLKPKDDQPIFITHENRNHFNSVVKIEFYNNNQEIIYNNTEEKLEFLSGSRKKRKIKQSTKFLEWEEIEGEAYIEELDSTIGTARRKRIREDGDWNISKKRRLEEMEEDIQLEINMNNA
jgi:hypothetical protein